MKPRFSLFLLFALLLIAASSKTARADDWLLVRGDTLGSGIAKCDLPDKLEALWTYKAGKSAGFEATAVVADGVIYVGDNDGTLHAVRIDHGTTVWKKKYD